MSHFRYVTACERGDWHLKVWKVGDPFGVVTIPYRCKSWRHTGPCCLWKGAQDWVRVKEAIESRDRWVYVVVTFSQRDWDNWIDQYKYACVFWSKVHRRMERAYERVEYIQTWERHKEKGIHANVLLHNRWICDIVEENRMKWKKGFLEPTCVACGFGKISWVQSMRTGSARGMAGYMTKLARELVGANQKGQIPFDAPPHFRRLRATRGLLPKVVKSDEWTGAMQWESFVDAAGEVLCSSSGHNPAQRRTMCVGE